MARIDDIKTNENIDSLFSTYEKPEKIGQQIFKDFIKLYTENKGFPMDDSGNKGFGIISNCMALSTLLDLNVSMGVDISDFEEGFKFLLTYIYGAIHGNASGLVFDASPYMMNTSDLKIDSYIETVSKICVIMIDLREYAIRNDQLNKSFGKPIVLKMKNGSNFRVNDFRKLKEAAEQLLIDSIDILTKSCLKVKESEVVEYRIDSGKPINRAGLDSKIRYRGWSFQMPKQDENDEYSVSIYFTYHATNAFISLYNAFEKMFENKTDVQEMSDDEREKYNFDIDFFNANKALFLLFRDMTSSTGRYIDSQLTKNEVDLSFDYIKSGFKGVSSSKIMESQKTNIIIDTLLVLAILINAGIDEDYASKGDEKKEYFYNKIQYSLTNVKKIYNILKQSKKEDLIDSYQLDSALLNDKFPSAYDVLVRNLRSKCLGVAVYDFVPLFCNTYAIIFNYLIQYPQKEMIENLEWIMENRANDIWLWDKKGFNANNNLYYIFALENFYAYYNVYELPLSNKGKEYNVKADEAKKRLEKKNEELQKAQDELRQVKKSLEEKRSDLDAEVYKIAKKMYDKNIENSIKNFINDMIEDCCRLSLEIASKEEASTIKTILSEHPKATMLFKIANCNNLARAFIKNDVHLMEAQMQNNAIEKCFLGEIDAAVNPSYKHVGE